MLRAAGLRRRIFSDAGTMDAMGWRQLAQNIVIGNSCECDCLGGGIWGVNLGDFLPDIGR